MSKITHNIALTFGEDVSASFVSFAQRHLSDINAGYMLGDGSVPHVTLAHLNMDDEQVQRAKKVFEKLENPTFNIGVLNIYSAARENNDRLYCGYTVRKTRALTDFQVYVAKCLEAEGIDTSTNSGDLYFPHITLGNFGGGTAPQWDMSNAIYEGSEMATSLSFGTSDDIGQFTKIIIKK